MIVLKTATTYPKFQKFKFNFSYDFGYITQHEISLIFNGNEHVYL